jgi:hypothetical protein
MATASTHGSGSSDEGGVSRRKVLAGAGVAVAATAAGALATSGTVDASSDRATPPGTTVIEFISRITQDGLDFSGLGYLTAVAGMPPNELFTDPDVHSEATALFVSVASGVLTSRSVDGVVHALDIDGELNVYRRDSSGAAWSDPASFSSGTLAATFDLVLQDVLTVIAPQTGLPTLNGTARQTRAANVKGRQLGAPGQLLRFTATGFGTRSDAGTASPQAQLTIAGSLSAV